MAHAQRYSSVAIDDHDDESEQLTGERNSDFEKFEISYEDDVHKYYRTLKNVGLVVLCFVMGVFVTRVYDSFSRDTNTNGPTSPPFGATTLATASALSTRIPTTLSPTPTPIDVQGTLLPTLNPVQVPVTLSSTHIPVTLSPTLLPTRTPVTSNPTDVPATFTPTLNPIQVPVTLSPTHIPVTLSPTLLPTNSPVTLSPTLKSIKVPVTLSPTHIPVTLSPTYTPVNLSPTLLPTNSPVAVPSTSKPTYAPVTLSPTMNPTTVRVTLSPNRAPITLSPTLHPTKMRVTLFPTHVPVSGSPTRKPTGVPMTSPPTIPLPVALSASTIDAKTTPLALHPEINKVAQIIVTRGDDPEAIQVHFSAIEKAMATDPVCGATVPGGVFSLKFWIKGEKDSTIRAVDAIRVGCYVAEIKRTGKLHMFTASFENLKDATLYQYEIGQAAAVGLSGAGKALSENTLFHLGSAALPGVALNGTALSKESNKQTIVTVGDMDMRQAKLVAAGIAAEEHFSLFVHLGDGSYASNLGDCYNGDLMPKCFWNCPRADPTCGGRIRSAQKTAHTWDSWHEVMDPITSAVPYVTTMGNHDNDIHSLLKFRPPVPNTRKPNVLESDLTTQETACLVELFELQNTGDSVAQQTVTNDIFTNPHFFSFDHGLVHIVSLGSEDNPINPYEMLQATGGENSEEARARFDLHYGVDSLQYKWLVRDLQKAHAKRDTVPWIVVYTHRPPYHTSSHHPNCRPHGDWFGCKWRALYSTLFEEAGVNLVLSGHSHHYMRTWPIKEDKVAEQGNPNAPVYVVCGTGGYSIRGGWVGSPDWMAVRDLKYGFCKFTLLNATALDWSFVATNSDGSNSVEDHTVIIQPEHSTRPKVLVLGSSD